MPFKVGSGASLNGTWQCNGVGAHLRVRPRCAAMYAVVGIAAK
jgi:hypothetical protein